MSGHAQPDVRGTPAAASGAASAALVLGAIADDFTGASDLVNLLAQGGLRAAQSVGVPRPHEPAPPGTEAVVVALKSRSIAPAEAVAQSLAAYEWLRAAGAQRFLFKICSTFDSTPRGNIGPVAEALRAALGPERAGCVPVCPAFPSYGRRIYRGHLFVGDVLLSDSPLREHPLNPMTDASLVRVLAAQTSERVGLLPLAEVRAGPAAIRAGLDALAQEGVAFAIIDCDADADLLALAAATAAQPLRVGGSGIALGLPAALACNAARPAAVPPLPPLAGPCAVLAGSCSTATRRQIEVHRAAGGAQRRLDLARLAEPALAAHVADLADWCVRAAGAPLAPLVASSATPQEIAAAGSGALAPAIERGFAALACALVERGVRRLIVAGGETSGAVVDALGLRWLAYAGEIDPGAPAMRGDDGRGPLGLALKSGNFGGADFFQRALRFV